MSPTRRSSKTARKATKKPARKATGTKSARARAPAKRAKKAAARKVPRKAAAKKSAARKAPRRKTAARKATKKSAVVKKSATKKATARRSAAKSATTKTTKTARRRTAPTGSTAARAAPAKRATAQRRRRTITSAASVTPDVARQHFQELLEAKQARVRQGPSYPAANAFTGQRAVDGSAPAAGSDNAPPRAPPDAGKPAPEATFGESTVMHGRGNQGMRPQK